jgi:hypothetical protein
MAAINDIFQESYDACEVPLTRFTSLSTLRIILGGPHTFVYPPTSNAFHEKWTKACPTLKRIDVRKFPFARVQL